MTFLQKVLLLFTLALPLTGAAQSSLPREEQARIEVRAGIKAMDAWYAPGKGVWHGVNEKGEPLLWWWNSANAINMLVRYVKFTGERSYLSYVDAAFEKNKRGRFLNEFYDDEGWWGLAWVEAYEVTRDQKYLAMAQVIFADMTNAWSDDFGGGLWWKKDHKEKNAIENNLFILLGLRLHAHRPNEKVVGKTYLEWAKVTWDWYEKSAFIRPDGRVADGFKRDGALNEIFFTYNQGVTMACALELHKVTKDKKFLDLANRLADTALTKMVDKDTGVLREWLEPHSTQDLAQFKGIFMRHLYSLYEFTRDARYQRFIFLNAEAIHKNKEPEKNYYGVSWFLPYKEKHYDFVAHSSALDALVSAVGAMKITPRTESEKRN